MSSSSPQHNRRQPVVETEASAGSTSMQARVSSSRYRESALLTAQLEAAVRRATSDRVRNLRVTLQDDCITIQGRCATFYCKQMAQQAALALLAHESLVNNIEVY